MLNACAGSGMACTAGALSDNSIIDAVPVHLGDAPLLDVHDPVLDSARRARGK